MWPSKACQLQQKGLSAKGIGNNMGTPAYYKEQVMTYADEDFNRYTRDYSRNNPDEREAIQKEHMNRINQGVEAWNEFDDAFAEYIKKHNISDPYYDFVGATFSGNAIFYKATFSGNADFSGAKFSGKAYFVGATFRGVANFHGAKFSGNTNFSEATFSQGSVFDKAIFSEDVEFRGATFSGETAFTGATFSEVAYFVGTTFDDSAYFMKTKFESILVLVNVTAKESAPDFAGIDYKTPPIIDGLSVPRPKKDSNPDIDSYRQLKMIAIDGANHEKELEFFGYETQCKLYLDDTPWPSIALIGSYLFFSDFGQSILRPILGLFFVFLVASASTHITVEAGCDPVACENVEHTGAFESKSDAAWSQSIDFILPILKADRGTLRQRNQCLYGHDGVPRINRLINFIQQIVSLVFLFLAGLAIRNRFKIK